MYVLCKVYIEFFIWFYYLVNLVVIFKVNLFNSVNVYLEGNYLMK